MKKPNWKGVFPAVTTEFDADCSLALDATAGRLSALLSAGVHGFVMLGTVGENNSLEYREKLAVLERAVAEVNGRVPVLTGVSEFTTAVACRFSRDAETVGVNGLMVLPAMAYKSDTRETLTHFRAVCRSSHLPVMAYNNPGVYGVDIKPLQFAELVDEPALVAIKESSEDVRRLTDIRNLTGDRYILFEGVDDLAVEGALMGADGWVSGLVNAFPREAVRLWQLATDRKVDEALALNRWFAPLLHLDTCSKLVQYIKLANSATGTGTEFVRPPRLPIEGEERDSVLALINKALATRPDMVASGASQPATSMG